MAEYIELDGIRTWFDRRGEGEPLVLLHGGLSDSRDFESNLAGLAGRFTVFLPERRGHGRTPDVEGPITVDLMVGDTVTFIEKVVGGPVRLAGYSDGAVIALEVARRRPELVERLVLVSGVFRQQGMILGLEADAELPAAVAEAYGEVSPDGVAHLPVVQRKLAEAFADEPSMSEEDLARVRCRTLVVSADDDLVSLEHTLAMYRGIPDAELAVLPGTSHVLLIEKPRLFTAIVREFLCEDPVPTFAPLRRA
ncbi:alpha/beta hydrolase [Saccharomonospora sp. NPDC006951]